MWGNKATEIVKRWFRYNINARKNWVIDYDFESRFPKLKEIHNAYPGVKTCTVVINPYARALIQYEWAKENKKSTRSLIPIIPSSINVDTFEAFLSSILKKNFTLLGSSQTSFITYKEDDKIVTTDIILRSEFIEEEFYKVQDFVKSRVPIIINNKENIYSYREHYDSTTKELVSKIFKEDLENFNYSF